MKKILSLSIFVLFTFMLVFANNTTEKNKEKEETSTIINTTVIRINSDEITIPYTITVPVPSGTVKSISGPCNANMRNWTVNNGSISITYTTYCDIGCLQDPDTYYIEYVTEEGHHYKATIISE